MTKQEKQEYAETRQHWQQILEAVGMVRVSDSYRDALFMVVPKHRLAALRDTITENGGDV